jgi:ribonucleoside-triphosphate reductase
LFEALTLQEELQTRYTGGTVLHGFIGEQIEDLDVLKDLLYKSLQQTRIPYLTITPTYSICSEHGYLAGEQWNCPTCGSQTEVWSRVVGFHRPVQSWNKGKQEEFSERQTFGAKETLKEA